MRARRRHESLDDAPRSGESEDMVKTKLSTPKGKLSTPAARTSPLPKKILLLGALAVGAFAATFGMARFLQRDSAPQAGMVWIPGGEFTMGSNEPYALAPERPAQRVRVDGFWMDETDVTNAQFRRFVEATGYVTIAEKVPTEEEIMRSPMPGAAPARKEDLVPASLVFTPPSGPVPTAGPNAYK